jgi:hypothetical protein
MNLRLTRFNDRLDAPAQHRQYQLILGVQGFTRSHWTPSLGEYSHRIAPDGRWGLMPNKIDEKVPYLQVVLLALAVRRYKTKQIDQMEGVQGYHGSHWSTPPGKYGGR